MVLTKNMKYTFIQALSKTLLNTDFILEISLGINSHSNNNTTFFNTYYRLSTFLSVNSFIIQSSGLICGLCPHILASRLQNSCLSSCIHSCIQGWYKRKYEKSRTLLLFISRTLVSCSRKILPYAASGWQDD